MSDSSLQNGCEDGVPAWMEAVDRENLYSATPKTASEEAIERSHPTSSSDFSSATRQPEKRNEGKTRSTLRKKLSVSMGDARELPEPDPDVQPTEVGHVRVELNQWLEKAVAILNTRYERKISKTLVLEYVIRQELVDLQVHDEESPLVQWLDSIVPRS